MYSILRKNGSRQTVSFGWRAIGYAILLVSLVFLLNEAWQWIAEQPTLRIALASGSIAAFATALGVVPMLVTRAPGRRT